jgi:hypothetical protein
VTAVSSAVLSAGENPRPTEASESVFIDVDETHGALLLHSTPEREGLEPEIYPVGNPDGRTHVWVLPRKAGDAITYAAIFPSLPAGDYVLVESDGVTETVITVTPGEVTIVEWS